MMEGLPPRYNYTNDQWFAIREIQKYVLSLPYQGKAYQLYVTKMYSKPLQAMAARVDEIIKGKADNRDSLRYVIHS